MLFKKKNFLEKRIKNIKVFGYLLQLAPFVKALIITGSMTNGTASEKSDIDFLIVTAPRRLFSARLFATFWAQVTGLRRKPFEKNPAGKFCLNYYLSSDNLDILPHTARCAKFHRLMISVWDKEGVFEKVFRKNQWLREFKASKRTEVEAVNQLFPLDRVLTFSLLRWPFEAVLRGSFGGLIEKLVAGWQKNRIIRSELYKKNKSTIIVTDNELRLHPRKI